MWKFQKLGLNGTGKMKTSNEVITANAPKLHKGQLEVLKGLTDNRFVICVAGRRWGRESSDSIPGISSSYG